MHSEWSERERNRISTLEGNERCTHSDREDANILDMVGPLTSAHLSLHRCGVHSIVVTPSPLCSAQLSLCSLFI